MQREFSGKVVMITGAARGIGKETAELFSANGAALALGDVKEQQVREVADECATRFKVDTLAIGLDVRQVESVRNFVRRTVEKFGRIDVLVNSAGVCEICPIEDITEAAWDRMMDINVKGLFMVSQAVLPIMKNQRNGCIVNLGSLAGLVGGVLVGAHYAASKGAVITLTKSFAKAGAPYNVRANSVSPGFIDTDMTKDFGYDPKSVPLGYIGKAAEVADAIYFLASSKASYITGANLEVNGGYHMG